MSSWPLRPPTQLDPSTPTSSWRERKKDFFFLVWLGRGEEEEEEDHPWMMTFFGGGWEGGGSASVLSGQHRKREEEEEILAMASVATTQLSLLSLSLSLSLSGLSRLLRWPPRERNGRRCVASLPFPVCKCFFFFFCLGGVAALSCVCVFPNGRRPELWR